MRAFDFCRLHTLSLDRLKLILGKNDIMSDYVLSSEECNVYQLSLNSRKIEAHRGRKKINKAPKKSPVKGESNAVKQVIKDLRHVIKNPSELAEISNKLSSLNTKKDLVKFRRLNSLEIAKGKLIRSLTQLNLDIDLKIILSANNLARLKPLRQFVELETLRAGLLNKLMKKATPTLQAVFFQRIKKASTVKELLKIVSPSSKFKSKSSSVKNMSTRSSVWAIYTPMGNKR
jgi:hypothetical protein